MKFSVSAVALLATVATATSHYDQVYGPHANHENTFDYRGLRASIISHRKNLQARQVRGRGGRGSNGGAQTATPAASSAAAGSAAATCLDPAAVQTGSAQNGQVGASDPGQQPSLTYASDLLLLVNAY